MSMPGVPLEQGNVAVRFQDQTSEIVEYYLHAETVTPTLTAPAPVDDRVLDVDDTVGVLPGHAITLREGGSITQTVVKSVTAAPGATITLQSPLDKAYTVAASVVTGDWNMAVNGSVTPVSFVIYPPPSAGFHIYTINFSITDNTAMDSAKFGGISALANGVLLSVENGVRKSFLPVVNNLGFSEQFYNTTYETKAPAGVYGYWGYKSVIDKYGVALFLDGSNPDQLIVLIEDDLSALTNLNFTVAGHVVED